MPARLLVAALLLAGCYAPSVQNGELQCSIDDKRCPIGFHCAVDSTCWKNGQDPGTATNDGGSDDLSVGGNNLGPGEACGDPSQCTSGFCSPDGVCCDRACTGGCEACNLAGSPGVCANVAAGAMPAANHASCGPDAQSTCMRDGTCDGNGGCHLWSDVVCKPGSCDPATNKATAASKCDGAGTCVTPNALACDPFLCLPDMTACYGTCTAPAVGCKPPNSCVSGSCGPKVNGSPCSAGTECQSGKCAPDGVCCDLACTGNCEACNIAPNVGTCTAVTSGQPRSGHGGNCAGFGSSCGGSCVAGNRATCGFPGNGLPNVTCSGQVCANTTTQQNAATCNGAGACSTPTTMDCGAYRCSSSACVSSCASSTDDSPCAPGNYCNAPQCLTTKPVGRMCGATTECTSTFCVDSTCCSSACTGQCQRCDAPAGSCSDVSGAPVNGRAACPTGESTCGATCTGSSPDCAYAASGTACTDPRDGLAASCTGGGACFHAGSCFVAGTLVDTAAGRRPIETIRAGDLIRSFDVLGGVEHLRPVQRLQQRRASSLVSVALADGSVLRVTPEHYFWVHGSGWVRAVELTAADRLLGASGASLAVRALASLAIPGGETTVYNLDVVGEGTYFVGEVPVLVESCDYTGFSSWTADELPR